MASGTISFSGSDRMYGRIVWSSKSDIASNTSTVTASLQVCKDGAYSGTTGTFSGSLAVGSSGYSGSHYGTVDSSWVEVASGSATVTHDSDGKGTCYLSGSIRGPSGTSLAGHNASGSATVTLDTIPRASTFTCSGGSLGSAVTFAVTRKSTSFSHEITYKCGSASGTAVSKTTTENVSWTPPLSLAAQNTTGATVSVDFTLTTYSGSTVIASSTQTVNLSIPDSVAPTVSASVSDASGYYSTYGAYVQGRSTVKITLTASGIYGSEVTSQQVKFDDKTYLGQTNTTDAIKGSGTMQLVATVKDSRGKTGTSTASIQVLAYSPPKVSTLDVTRCDSSGEKNASGAYLIVEFSASVTSLSSKNSAAYKIRYKKSSATSYTSVTMSALAGKYTANGSFIFAADKSVSYDVILEVTDNFGTVQRNAVGPSELTLWSVLKNGMGFAFGRVAELANALDMGWPIRMNGNRVYGLPTPTEDSDAATKAYVDTADAALPGVIYPVGAVYISTSDTSPASLFGGTWERIQDVFLLAAGSTYTAGQTGGEATHTLTISEMPKHDHWGSARFEYDTISGSHPSATKDGTNVNLPMTDKTGGGAAHNNMPPYLAVYVWKRVS